MTSLEKPSEYHQTLKMSSHTYFPCNQCNLTKYFSTELDYKRHMEKSHGVYHAVLPKRVEKRATAPNSYEDFSDDELQI